MTNVMQLSSLLAAGLSTIGAVPDQPALSPEPTPVVARIDDELAGVYFNLKREDFRPPVLSELCSRRQGLSTLQISGYLKALDHSLLTVVDLPEVALKQPEIAHKIREKINQELRPGGPTLNQGELSEIIHSSSVASLPDLLELIQVTSAGEIPALLPNWIYSNPRVIEYAWQQELLPSEQATGALLKMQQALKALGIEEFRRFDNARELICNRYWLAQPAVQQQLRELLGSDYFTRVRALDQRPVAVVCFPSKNSDHNGAFREFSKSYSDTRQDAIDYLTSRYRVFYFECDRDRAAYTALQNVYQHTGKQIELVLFGGHGEQSMIALGGDFDEVAIDLKDADKLQQLAHMIKPGAEIILDSCSTGSNAAGKTSIAEVISRSWPGTNVYAPDAPTNSRLEFKPDGTFERINFIKAGLVHFKPDGTVTREFTGPIKPALIGHVFSDFFYDFYNDLKNISLAGILKWCIATVVVGLVLGSTLDIVKRIPGLVFRRRQSGQPQLTVFDPESRENTAA